MPFPTTRPMSRADAIAALAKAEAQIDRAFTGAPTLNSKGEHKAHGAPQQGGSVARELPTALELACRHSLTRSDIPASERAFVQALVDQADRERGSAAPAKRVA